ncbi:MAG TPA: hypothetical protein VFV71_11665 [Burkholderiales bacterium]|nr:hypothetical protein [Burkholderiales bacterium]
MNPTPPEDRELDELAREVSERYRIAGGEEPSRGVDEAVLAAARRETEAPRRRAAWRVPASIAAVFVLAVSLGLVLRGNEPLLPSLEAPGKADVEQETRLAKPEQLAMKAPRPKTEAYREARPSRERTARPDREPVVRDEAAAKIAQPAPPAAPAGIPPPAQSGRAAPAPSAGAPGANGAQAPAADALPAPRATAQALRKQKSEAAPQPPREWLRRIDELAKAGREAEARDELLAFRRQYPAYEIPAALRTLLPEQR